MNKALKRLLDWLDKLFKPGKRNNHNKRVSTINYPTTKIN